MTRRESTMGTTISPKFYIMAEGRAQHEPSGLWHYVRAYGVDPTTAELTLRTNTLERNWVLDTESIRLSPMQKGIWP